MKPPTTENIVKKNYSQSFSWIRTIVQNCVAVAIFNIIRVANFLKLSVTDGANYQQDINWKI